MATARTYPSGVKEAGWELVAPILCPVPEAVPQRNYALRGLFTALRYLAHTGCPRRYLPHELPPWATAYQQWTRWRAARVFESIGHDVKELPRVLLGREATPRARALVLAGRTLQSTPPSGHRAGWDGAKRRKGSQAHIAGDTPGHSLSGVITPANGQERAPLGELGRPVGELGRPLGELGRLVGELGRPVREVTGQSVRVGIVDQGCTGEQTECAAAVQAIDRPVVTQKLL